MNDHNSSFITNYLIDTRDRILFGITPTLMQPIHGHLEPPPLHQHRFVIGQDGVYLQARTHTLSLCLRVTTDSLLCPLPYGSVKEYIKMIGGPIPYELMTQIKQEAVRTAPHEWAGAVVWESNSESYKLVLPEILSSSSGHVRYNTERIQHDDLVLDIHSHGATGDAYFSTIDDASDKEGGIYLASVLGHCVDTEKIVSKSRIVINGIFYPVPWDPWENKPPD